MLKDGDLSAARRYLSARRRSFNYLYSLAEHDPMTPTPHLSFSHFDRLVKHLITFDEAARREIASIYGAPASDPATIARFWCEEPENFARVARREIGDPQGWEVLLMFSQDHDLEVDISWLGAEARGVLRELGILGPVYESDEDEEAEVIFLPGALAAILAPHVQQPTRVTLPILLGKAPGEVVERLLQVYGLRAAPNRIENILVISDAFREPNFPAQIMERMDNPQWIGAAMMALEHGGICYWREIFGYDPEEEVRQDNVVPLMRHRERAEQQQAGEALAELGVLLPLEDMSLEFMLVAVPEELWYGLWSIGHEWLSEWVRVCHAELEDIALRRQRELGAPSTQALMKWLYIELSREPRARSQWLDEGYLAGFRQRITRADVDPEIAFSLARSLDLFHPEQPELCESHDASSGICAGATSLLDLSRPAFARRLLSDWVNGEIGARADLLLGQAVGLDEEWQARLLEVLEAKEMPVLDWMRSQGISHVETGAGCLREIAGDDEPLIMGEVIMTHACIRIAKLVWLDVLSLLEPGNWHSVAQMGELLHYSAALALSSMLEYVVEDPHTNYYFPLQGPSMLSAPAHLDAFADWAKDIITEILEPAGLASFDPEDGRAWLDVKNLRVPTPPDFPAEMRQEFIADIFEGADLDFEVPEDYGAPLRSLSPTPRAEDQLPADAPLATLMEATKAQEVVGFDGRVFTLAPR